MCRREQENFKKPRNRRRSLLSNCQITSLRSKDFIERLKLFLYSFPKNTSTEAASEPGRDVLLCDFASKRPRVRQAQSTWIPLLILRILLVSHGFSIVGCRSKANVPICVLFYHRVKATTESAGVVARLNHGLPTRLINEFILLLKECGVWYLALAASLRLAPSVNSLALAPQSLTSLDHLLLSIYKSDISFMQTLLSLGY